MSVHTHLQQWWSPMESRRFLRYLQTPAPFVFYLQEQSTPVNTFPQFLVTDSSFYNPHVIAGAPEIKMKHNPSTESFHKQTYSSPGLNTHIPQKQMGKHKPSLKTPVPGQVRVFSQVWRSFCIPCVCHWRHQICLPSAVPVQDQMTSKKTLQKRTKRRTSHAMCSAA